MSKACEQCEYYRKFGDVPKCERIDKIIDNLPIPDWCPLAAEE